MDRSAIRKFADAANRSERRKAERLYRISKVLKPGSVFHTGNGKINKVVMSASKRLCIKAKEGKEIISISALSIKRMIAYFMRIRIVERKELSVFHTHSSAMFGLLATIYGRKAKVNKTRGLLRLVMTGIRMFFASFERCPSDLREAVDCGAEYVLASYFYARDSARWRYHLIKHDLRCILDSGAFSAWMAQKNGRKVNPLDIDQYIAFIRANDDIIDHYFAFDHIGNWQQTMQNLRYMEQRNMTPIPIYHFGTPIEVLEELVAGGYPVIALGGTVNQKKQDVEDFFDKVFTLFPKQEFHGLGVSRSRWLKRFPFFSCDSKAWITVRWKEVVLSKNGQFRAPFVQVKERWNQSVKFWTSLERSGVYSRYSLQDRLAG
jgi:hypothetical protein